jgi:hypothetical protein
MGDGAVIWRLDLRGDLRPTTYDLRPATCDAPRMFRSALNGVLRGGRRGVKGGGWNPGLRIARLPWEQYERRMATL